MRTRYEVSISDNSSEGGKAMKKKDHPIIYGEVLFDQFPDGTETLGGAPFNVAWHLQGLGYRPLFISKVGDDPAGCRVLETMKTWGMDISAVQMDPMKPTGTVRVAIKNGEPSFEILPDQAYDHIDTQPALEVVQNAEAALLYHGSMICRSDKSTATLNALKQHISRGTFVDLNLRTPWWNQSEIEAMVQHTEWLKLNRNELLILTRSEVNTEKKLMDLAGQCADRWNLEGLIVTLGREGAFMAASAKHVVTVPAVKVERFVDSVGAGDGFSAVAIIGVLEGWHFGTIVRRAVAFAADVCQHRGALIHEKTVYEACMERWNTDVDADGGIDDF
jgi:fructokinase